MKSSIEIESFLTYYRKVKTRTMKLFPLIPEGKLEWTCAKGKFTIGDLIRHLALIERYMFLEIVQNRPSKYRGCGIEFANGIDNVTSLYEELQSESYRIMSSFPTEYLHTRCITPIGAEVTVWKWLRSMIEHEVHHRGQLYTYLGILGIDTPPLLGLTSEQLID